MSTLDRAEVEVLPPEALAILEYNKERMKANRLENLKKGVIMLNEIFTPLVMERILDELDAAAGDRNVDVITLRINSNGGDCSALMPMVDWIERCPKPVRTVVQGKAYSCGAMLLMSGTKGQRIASKRSSILIHEVSNDYGYAKASQHHENAEHIKYVNEQLIEMIKAKTKMKPAEISRYMHSNLDIFISPEMALKYGIIDKIL